MPKILDKFDHIKCGNQKVNSDRLQSEVTLLYFERENLHFLVCSYRHFCAKIGVIFFVNLGLFSCAKDQMGEKTRERRTENKISRKSVFKKKQLPFNQNELNFASFKTKPLKFKICSSSAVVSDNLKILPISVVLIFGQYQYSVPGNVYFLSKF